MKFDIFFSLCQGSSDKTLPNEKKVFDNFISQVKLADELGVENLWLAESHLSSEAQKNHKSPVIPNFKGEVGLNVDILQLAHVVYSVTKNINIGSAIRNILCNGGPLAHAETIRYFLFLNNLYGASQRKVNLGFASGRFEYSNRPYFIKPRDPFEEKYWKYIKPKILKEATQIFLKALKGDLFSSAEIKHSTIERKEISDPSSWNSMRNLCSHLETNKSDENIIYLKKWWEFEKTQIIPKDVDLKNLDLYLGSHDPEIQILANEIYPCKVFNLSITSNETINQTHMRMHKAYSKNNLSWKREFMPRTVMIFLNGQKHLSSAEQSNKAKEHAKKALENYWRAIEGTLDPKRVASAVCNSLCGNPEEICEQIRERFHPDDRLMLWFDFNCHDNDLICHSMKTFTDAVLPRLLE